MNYYAEAIKVMARDDIDYRAIAIQVAMKNPSVFMAAVVATKQSDLSDMEWKKQVVEMLEAGKRVQAVKFYREKTKASLKEAIEECEKMSNGK